MAEIYDIDYNRYVNIIGTVHFTRRSINDAYDAIRSFKPEDVALELDWRRFRLLNIACVGCPRRESCGGICEFTGAAEALGNVDANIWLIDMTEKEMRQRIISKMAPFEIARIGFTVYNHDYEDPVQLWERGFKDRAIKNSRRNIEDLREVYPSIWRVLIDERNSLMAARLAWIVTKNLNGQRKPYILTFVGAAHVKGIKELLSDPPRIKEKLGKFNLPFTEPTLIRRVAIQGN